MVLINSNSNNIIIAKRPEKIDTQNPVTLQLIKDMQANQNGIFAISRLSTSLYLI